MFLCKFKNILGEPGKGIHKLRIGNFALLDALGTIILGWLLSKYTKLTVIQSIIGLFIVGQMLHFIFCVDTAFMNLLNVVVHG